MKSTGCQQFLPMTSVTAFIFFIIMQRLSGFLNCRLSPTNVSQQHQRLTKTHLAVRERKHICLFPFCFDSLSINSSSGLAVKGWKLL